MSSAESSFLIWPPVLGRLVIAYRVCDRNWCLPVQTLNLDRLAVLDGGGKGDWLLSASDTSLMEGPRYIYDSTYCRGAICSGIR
jgi:hypothetical protein